MKGRESRLIAFALVATLAIAVVAAAAPGLQDAASLTIKPARLTGTVVYADGKTPAAKVPVRVWSVEESAFVHETTTTAAGAYEIPELAPGRYVLVVGDRVRVDLLVQKVDGVVPSALKVVIPRGKPLVTPAQLATELAQSGPAAGAGAAGGGSLLKTSLIGAGGLATAVGVYEGTSGSLTGGGGHDSSGHRQTQPVISP